MDDGLLGKRGTEIADRRAGVVDPAVEPRVEDRGAGFDVVVVGLEPVDQSVLLRREAPDLAGPEGVGSHLVHLPVVRGSIVQRVRSPCALRDAVGQRQILRVRTEVHIVRGRLAAGAPAQSGVRGDVGRGIGRLRLAGLHGDIEEANLAQAVLGEHAPVAVDGQPDVFGRYALKVHDAVVSVASLCAGPGQLGVAEHSPVGSVGGVFDCHTLEPESEHQLEFDVVVPDPHFVELVDLVEFVLDVDGFIPGRQAQPHV